MLPLITLEEHYIAPDPLLPSHVSTLYANYFKHNRDLEQNLRSLDTLRFEGMETAGIAFQIISHVPGLSSSTPAECSKVNDYLASKIGGKKDVFGGFAVLPMGYPEEAAIELKRVVTDFGFLGIMVDNHITSGMGEVSGKERDGSNGLGATYYDSPQFYPIWEAAQDLQVPIYFHPMFPTPAMQSHYDTLPSAAGSSIATGAWAWHSECGSHILRLYATGVFDAFPRLKIVIGHFGEMLPYMLGRVEKLSSGWAERKRSFRTVYDENIVITTSGVWDVAPMHTIKATAKIENVLFSIDWPFTEAELGKTFWQDLQTNGIYNKDEMDCIGWKNAVRLFNLDEGRLLERCEMNLDKTIDDSV